MKRIRFTLEGVLSAALAVLLLALGGCQSSAPSRAAEETPAPIPQLVRQSDGVEMLALAGGQVPGMTLADVREVDLPSALETTGQVALDDRRVSTIVSRVAGRIEATRVSQWDYVRRGEPIVELYSPDFMTAEAEYLQAETTSKLSSSRRIAMASADLAGAMVSAAKRKLELLGMSQADIAAITAPSPTIWVRAPISGTVFDNKAMRGIAVNPGDILYSLGTLDEVWITADIYEDDLARVREGQQLEAVTTAYPDEVFHGAIARVSPNIDPNTHTAQIRCAVKNPGARLKPQMLAEVRILVRPGKALVVPLDALVFESDSYFAYVDAGNNRLERRKVVIGSWSQRGYARVVSGLNAGDRVVTNTTMQVNELWHEAHGERS